jgi:hypothetical protein
LRRDCDDWHRQYSLKCDQIRDLQEVNARLRADISSLHDRSCSPQGRAPARHFPVTPARLLASGFTYEGRSCPGPIPTPLTSCRTLRGDELSRSRRPRSWRR